MKKISFGLIIILLGGLGGILAEHFLFPYLGTTSFFSKYEFLKRASQNVTVINKTEQVIIKEEFSIEKIINQVSSSIVNIVSYNETSKDKKISPNPLIKNGTGTIVTSDGIIMTYVSAIFSKDARYKVILFDGTIKDAELLGIDKYSQLAFLKIEANNLPTISFANSADAKIGEKIVAIGNNTPSYSNYYSSYVLGGFDANANLFSSNLSSSEKLEGFFRTNLSSDETYVGGPIVDYLGQVVGIIGVIENGSNKDFFQIPSNKVKIVLERALRKDLESAPYLGIYFLPATKTYLALNKVAQENGALVYSASGQQGLAIITGSPAQKAGLKIGDLIIALNGQEINQEKTLPDLLYQYKKGDLIELTLIRDGEELKIQVTL
jgi:S1-C subfamily serine protease